MRYLALAGLIVATAASANDAPATGPVPSWVIPQSYKAPTERGAAPVRLLLLDEQTDLTRGAVSRYSESAMLVQTAAGLAAGNVAFDWRPDFDTMTVNRLVLRRGDKTIDVLAGKKFTVLRRETNLENAMFDGRLTATLQIDGLEVGDIIDFAATIVSRDPTLGDHVEVALWQWNTTPIDRGHVRFHWAKDLDLHLRGAGDLPLLTPVADASGKSVEFTKDKIEPLIFPKGAPARFGIGRVVEATDFASWSDLAAMMAPLYAKAAVIDPGGDLAHQVDAIAAASSDPVKRASAALALVETKVRYLALAIGDGGLVPRGAEETWKSRLGDCKAKTALLIAVLHRLKIDAVPALISTQHGDGLDQRLPLVALFDHVLVRATIGGRLYWLDGTRPADTNIAALEVPNYRWALPLTGRGDRLAALIPAVHDQPDAAYALRIDARSGIFAPAPAEVVATFRGDTAMLFNLALSALAESSRDSQLRDFWKERYSFIEPSAVAATFDSSTGVETLSLTGTAKLKWDDHSFRIPGSSIAYNADFTRTSGIDRDAPFAVTFPGFALDRATIQLPPGITIWRGEVGPEVNQTLAGFAYHRAATLFNNELHMEKSERALVSEVPAVAARAVQERLRKINDEDVYLKNNDYVATDADMKALAISMPSSASEYFDRALLFMDREKFTEALSDWSKSHELDPKDSWALANRGLTYAHLKKPAEAEADFAAAEVLDPGNPVVARGRGLLATMREDYVAAIAQYGKALIRDPDNGFALNMRAGLNLQLGNLELARTDLDRELALNPASANARQLRAQVYLALNRNELARADLEEVLTRTPDDSVVRLAHANLMLALHRDDLTLADADYLAKSPKTDNYGIAAAAKIYAAVGHRDRGRALLDRAIAATPNGLLYVNRSAIRPAGDIVGQRADLDAALRLEPESEAYIETRGTFALDHGDLSTAVTDYAALTVRQPDNPVNHAMHGVALAMAGKTEDSRKAFATALTLAKTPRELNSVCWRIAIRNVALDSALIACNRALAAAPTMPAALDSRGFVELRMGRFDAAIADYDAALKLAPTQAASLFGRALAFRAKGDMPRAAADRTAAEKIYKDIGAQFKGYGFVID